ncbi:hypothetical protein [Streptomyces sp. SID12501]|uniref:Uncharacterized protein n=1 Tax=Streptomyces sp. SID12501 TaxID=2706042 RepID=A0A6B3C4I0_9ACTN|nr:hypothetical protein [Streptomyces sp. SID12501]NEC91579.1 hypothetical protein [Streptomyces sp. SID12501]
MGDQLWPRFERLSSTVSSAAAGQQDRQDEQLPWMICQQLSLPLALTDREILMLVELRDGVVNGVLSPCRSGTRPTFSMTATQAQATDMMPRHIALAMAELEEKGPRTGPDRSWPV